MDGPCGTGSSAHQQEHDSSGETVRSRRAGRWGRERGREKATDWLSVDRGCEQDGTVGRSHTQTPSAARQRKATGSKHINRRRNAKKKRDSPENVCANQIESFDFCCPRTPKLKGCDVDGPFVSIRPRKAQESHPPNRFKTLKPSMPPGISWIFRCPSGSIGGPPRRRTQKRTLQPAMIAVSPFQMATPTPHGAACARAFRRPVPAPAVLGALLSPFPSCPSRSWCRLGRSGTWRRGRIIRIITHKKKCSNIASKRIHVIHAHQLNKPTFQPHFFTGKGGCVSHGGRVPSTADGVGRRGVGGVPVLGAVARLQSTCARALCHACLAAARRGMLHAPSARSFHAS